MPNNLTLVSGTFNSTGKFGQSLNGGHAYTTVSPVTSYPLTLQAWVKGVASTDVEVIAGRAGVAWFGKAANNTAVAHYGFGAAGTTDGKDITLASSVNIADGAWHFLEVVVTANGGTFFVDGTLVSSSLAKPQFSPDNNYFGARAFYLTIASNSWSYPFMGEMDELAVFNTALHTAAYTVPTAPYTGTETGLVALYHFDGDANDSVPAPAATVAPNAPTVSGITAGDGSVSVSFAAATTGEIPTGYKLYLYRANGTVYGSVVGASSPLVYSDAALNGVAVYGKVSASNNIGESAQSAASSTVTPAAAPAAGAVAYNSTSVFYSPYNWDDRGTYKVSNNPGAYLKFNFTGTSAGVKFDVSALVGAGVAAGSYPIVRTIVDGLLAVDTQLTASTTTVSRTGLAAGSHTFEMHFLAADIFVTDRWSTPVNALRVTGFSIDSGATATAPALRTKTQLYYGDSINEGYLSNGSVSTQPVGNNSQITVATTLAQAFDCEYGTVAFSGHGYEKTGNGGVPALPAAYNLYSAGRSRLSGGVLSPAPDYVFIEHGANGTTVAGDVTSFIANVRAIAPTAKIIQLVPAGGFARAAIVAGFASAADANSILVDLGTGYQLGIQSAGPSPNIFSIDGIHRNQLSNQRVAAGYANKVRAGLDTLASSAATTNRTFSTQLSLAFGVAAANLTGLKIRCFNADGTLAYMTDTGTSDASGIISVVAQSTAQIGASCLMVVRNSDHNWANFVQVS